MPFKMVFDSNFEMKNVIATPNTMVPVRIKVDTSGRKGSVMAPAKNIVIIEINVGNRPLHGTKLLVKMAISRSRGESIIRQPMTPHALQPNPMHMVKEKMYANIYRPNQKHNIYIKPIF